MNAREMFEEQRYKRNEENEEIIYLQRFGSGYFSITFDLSKEEIAIDTNMENVIESDLLQAIIKQAKELGWLEEEQKQETNLEHYYEDLLKEKGDYGFANGKVKSCLGMSCDDCEFYTSDIKSCCKVKKNKWLSSPHKEYKEQTYKLTQFEYDLLQYFSVDFKFKEMDLLKEMKEKGHFKNINGDEFIKGILESCEVVKDEKC